MKRVLFALCLSLSVNGLCADAAPFFPPLQPIKAAAAPIEDYSDNITHASDPFVTPTDFNMTALNRVEQSLFGHSFTNQSIVARLARVEKSLFNKVFSTAPTTQRLDNIISNFNQINKYPNISRNNLSKIESKLLSQTFPQNSTERRIERLEQQIFGAVQSGDVDTRYKNLLSASKNYSPDTVISSYYPTPAGGSRLKNVLGNFGNTMLGGNMTGCTPPIDSYSAYGGDNASGYNTNPMRSNPIPGLRFGSGNGIYRGYGTNNGLGGYSYGESFNNYGTGTGVHILD